MRVCRFRKQYSRWFPHSLLTGFSVGASAEMNVPAKLIMVFTMLAGRIGPVTLMTSLIIRKNHNSDKNRILPEGDILVG